MKRRLFLVGLVCVLAATAAGAQSVAVLNLEGVCRVSDGGEQRVLLIGDELTADVVISLDEQSMCELQLPGRTVFLFREGDYALSPMLAGGARATQPSWWQRVGRFFRREDVNPTSPSDVGGVRGEEAVGDSVPWQSGSAREAIERGLRRLPDKPEEAVAILEDFAPSSFPEEEALVKTYLAKFYLLAGESVLAYRSLMEVQRVGYEYLDSEGVVQLAGLYLELGDIRSVEALLEAQVSALDPRYRPTGYLYLGVAYLELGKPAGARTVFSRVIEEAPARQEAEVARVFLELP